MRGIAFEGLDSRHGEDALRILDLSFPMTLSKYLRLASQRGCSHRSPGVYPDKINHVQIKNYENVHLTPSEERDNEELVRASR